MNFKIKKNELAENGYTILEHFYSNEEVNEIVNRIDHTINNSNSEFIKTKDLIAIRQLLNHIPELKKLIFNNNITSLLSTLFDTNYFLTKAIYFDKPKNSNWFVAFHQDLSISVDQKSTIDNYKNWTFKKGQYGVQPPVSILQDTITLRIHLDDTNKYNGALKIIPKSHLKGIIRTDSKNWNTEDKYTCEVKKGGIMLMKPLILHASNKNTNYKQRRVIHLEFNTKQLESPLQWLELENI